MPKRSGTVLHGYSQVLVESVNTTYRPEGVIVEEATVTMEKRAVVNTEKEKTAHKKIAKDLKKPLPPKQSPAKKDKADG
jgi:hypothetical protein